MCSHASCDLALHDVLESDRSGWISNPICMWIAPDTLRASMEMLASPFPQSWEEWREITCTDSAPF